MESFEDVLAVGGHANSLGRSAEVLKLVQTDRNRVKELFECIFAEDAWVRMRAIDTFEKLVRNNPAATKPFVQRIVSDLTKSEQASIQWHVAQLFTEIELDDKQTSHAIKWLKKRLSTTEVDWIVAVESMKALIHFHEQGSVLSEDLPTLFAIQKDHSSNTVRKKAQMFLDDLAKNKFY